MRKNITILWILAVSSPILISISFAQAPDTAWTRVYGEFIDEIASSIHQTSDNGYIISGYSGEGILNHPYDILLIKTDFNGDTVWAKSYGGVLEEVGYSAIQTSDGKYVIAGYTNSFGAGGRDLFIVKADENGDTLWTRTYGGADNDEGYSVIETADSAYLIAGYTASFGAGFNDVYLIKIDINGDTLWTKTTGDSLRQEGRSIAATSDGGYIITGLTGAISTDVYLIKVDENGDTLWTRSYDSILRDAGNYVQQTSDGGYIIAATSCGTTPDDPCSGYLIKTDRLGDTLWTSPSISGGLAGVLETVSGEFLATGGNYDPRQVPVVIELAVVKVDLNGETLWTEIFEGAIGKSLALTNDGGFIIAGDHIIYGCYYILGDVNGSRNYNGLDITYGVAFFKGGPSPICPTCPHSPQWYYCGDVNGSCSYNGVDITYGVAYFKGGPEPVPIPDFPPGGNTDVYLLKFSPQ
ncbi:MAG: hypothetical protein JSU85_13170 [Candidatus Zixiibacteriota bacterium]|nr:MAG: hypothetical protein JSU85_13170 [candidate division Zixibacteria bacterium]